MQKQITNKRTYRKVDNAKRAELLDLLNENMSIKQASTQLGINYENAKAIYRVWRIQKRRSKQLVRTSRLTHKQRPILPGNPQFLQPQTSTAASYVG